MEKLTNCETCTYYLYDEDLDCYVCQMNLDEDEMERFLSGSFTTAPIISWTTNMGLSVSRYEGLPLGQGDKCTAFFLL